jgi:hypothetical protein
MNLSVRYVLHLIRPHLEKLFKHGLGLARAEFGDLLKPKVQSPFDGWPKTRQWTDKHGDPCFRVKASVMSPEQAKLGDELGTLTTVLIVGAAVIYALNHNPTSARRRRKAAARQSRGGWTRYSTV